MNIIKNLVAVVREVCEEVLDMFSERKQPVQTKYTPAVVKRSVPATSSVAAAKPVAPVVKKVVQLPVNEQVWKKAPGKNHFVPLAKYTDLNVVFQGQMPVFYLGEYNGILKEAIARLKYRNEPKLGRHLGVRLGRNWNEHMSNLELEVDIVPIPSHPLKLKERGYNQAEEIARAFAFTTGMQMVPALERIKFAYSQVGQTAVARRQNVRGAFRCSYQNRPTKPVLLVDDVLTSGATLEEAAKVLRSQGYEVFGAVCVATGRVSRMVA